MKPCNLCERGFPGCGQCFGLQAAQAQLAQQGMLSQSAMQQQNALAQQGGSGQTLGQLYGLKPAAEPLQGQRVTELRCPAPGCGGTGGACVCRKPPGIDSPIALQMHEEALIEAALKVGREGKPIESLVIMARADLEHLVEDLHQNMRRANALADTCQTLRDENTKLLAENARLRRVGRAR